MLYDIWIYLMLIVGVAPTLSWSRSLWSHLLPVINIKVKIGLNIILDWSYLERRDTALHWYVATNSTVPCRCRIRSWKKSILALNTFLHCEPFTWKCDAREMMHIGHVHEVVTHLYEGVTQEVQRSWLATQNTLYTYKHCGPILEGVTQGDDAWLSYSVSPQKYRRNYQPHAKSWECESVDRRTHFTRTQKDEFALTRFIRCHPLYRTRDSLSRTATKGLICGLQRIAYERNWNT